MSINDAIFESEENGVLFSTDKKKIDVDYVHQFLAGSYWAKELPLSILTASIANSLSIGIYKDQRQVGFARLITDGATVAWLADVFVDERFRGQGISKELMRFIMSFDFIPSLRRIALATHDAHGLYRRFGFENPESPDKLMEILRKDKYLKKK